MTEISNKLILPAFLLSFFLGVLGAHRFYVGRTGSAIVMLILTLSFVGLFVSAVWNVVDFIRIIVGSFTDGEGKPLRKWTE